MSGQTRCEAAVPPGHPHVPCVRPFKHEGEHSATPRWVDLFGAAPGIDLTGEQERSRAAQRDAWLEGFRAHRDGVLACPHGYREGDHHWESGDCLAGSLFPLSKEPGV